MKPIWGGCVLTSTYSRLFTDIPQTSQKVKTTIPKTEEKNGEVVSLSEAGEEEETQVDVMTIFDLY